MNLTGNLTGKHLLEYTYWKILIGKYLLESYWKTLNGIHLLETTYWENLIGKHFGKTDVDFSFQDLRTGHWGWGYIPYLHWAFEHWEH